jgi:hypothetical protein
MQSDQANQGAKENPEVHADSLLETSGTEKEKAALKAAFS